MNLLVQAGDDKLTDTLRHGKTSVTIVRACHAFDAADNVVAKRIKRKG